MASLTPTPQTGRRRYTSRPHAGHVLNKLNRLRASSRFCDVEIVAGEQRIKAHRAVLAASSPYFHAMFTAGLMEQTCHTIELHDVPSEILKLLIDFIYSGKL